MPEHGLSRAIKRTVKAALAPAAGPGRFDRPIFVLAPPRSGSTFLFDCLAQAPGLTHLDLEADPIWWRHFPYERHPACPDAAPSDLVTAERARARGRALCHDLYVASVVQSARRERRVPTVRQLVGTAAIRYLDKTIANAFHLEVLTELFPDAFYVRLFRDPRPTIASMIEGWPYPERFGKAALDVDLASIPDRRIEHWCYPAPPGWETVVNRTLAEICAWNWCAHVESMRGYDDRLRNRLITVYFEDLIARPEEVMRTLARFLELDGADDMAAHARVAPPSPTTVTAPAADKWREGPAAEIDSVVPIVEPVAASIGYDLHGDIRQRAEAVAC